MLAGYTSTAVIGTTASGKTNLAVQLALKNNGEIISIDSRQVYKKLDIGTGKDLNSYTVNGTTVNVYNIDRVEPGQNYVLTDFIADTASAINQCTINNKMPIFCGGTHHYFYTLLTQPQYINIPKNEILQSKLENKTYDELIEELKKFTIPTNYTIDTNNVKRIKRAIEVLTYLAENKTLPAINYPAIKPYIIAVVPDLEQLQDNINKRLEVRLKEGLLTEVENLLGEGVKKEWLKNLGLEYLYVTAYLLHEINYTKLIELLRAKIFQYAKRQITWVKKIDKEFGINEWVR